MKREERQQQRAMASGRQRAPIPQQSQKRERVGLRQYLREIAAELRRVNWPTTQEVITYSIVVIFVVTVLTFVVFGLDLAFAQAVIKLFKPQTT
jgi:preprotein translocase subunit SecE